MGKRGDEFDTVACYTGTMNLCEAPSCRVGLLTCYRSFSEVVIVAARLTDKQIKRMIADRAEGMSYRALAKKYHVSATTIGRQLRNDPETAQKVAQKKEENTADILSHMETKKEMVTQLIDRYLEELLDEEKIKRATLNQLTTALGTVIDKWAPRDGNSSLVEGNMKALADLLQHPAPDRDIKDFEE